MARTEENRFTNECVFGIHRSPGMASEMPELHDADWTLEGIKAQVRRFSDSLPHELAHQHACRAGNPASGNGISP